LLALFHKIQKCQVHAKFAEIGDRLHYP